MAPTDRVRSAPVGGVWRTGCSLSLSEELCALTGCLSPTSGEEVGLSRQVPGDLRGKGCH